MAKSLPRPVAAPGSGAKGSSNSVTDKQGSVIGLNLKVLQVRGNEPILVIVRARLCPHPTGSTLSLLFLTGHKGKLQFVLLPYVDLQTTGNNCSVVAWFYLSPLRGIEDWTQDLSCAKQVFYH